MRNGDLVKKSRRLMWRQTKKNNAPAWQLTELAVDKGETLAKKYGARQDLVVVSLYLAHTIFSEIMKGKIQKGHTVSSSEFIKPYLNKWRVPALDQEIIINSIRAHHSQEPTQTIEAEVVKNAECFKFLTIEGILMILYDLGRRGVPWIQAIDYIKYKIDQKMSYLTLSDCKKEVKQNMKLINKLMSELSVD